MKIRSQFKDYYDYVEHVYGGGDEKNTYVRDIIFPDKVDGSLKWEQTQTFRNDEFIMHTPSNYQRKDGLTQEFCGIAIVGRIYIVTRGNKEPDWSYSDRVFQGGKSEPWKLATYGDLRKLNHWGKPNSAAYQNVPDDELWVCGEPRKQAIALSKELKAPIFKFTGDNGWKIEVFGRYPLLSEYGIASAIPAEQLYQEVSMFLMSVINDNPDTMPRSEMTNIQKVESHGFDKRVSFRHRK
jgi:hypothetical protein